MSRLLPILACVGLSACATAPDRTSGALSSYEGLSVRTGALRATVREKPIGPAPAVRRIAIRPPELVADSGTAWLSPTERQLLLREVEAQLCFELTERYELTDDVGSADATVRAVVTRVKPTGRVGSTAAAAAGAFIPGPIGVRAPGSLGGLSAEAEMLDPGGRQIAAVVWGRNANAIGTDTPSLSRIGDALQFVEPFADAAAKAMSREKARGPKDGPDGAPCAQFGPRFRPEGWLAKFATGLYVPKLSGAKGERAPIGEASQAVAR